MVNVGAEEELQIVAALDAFVERGMVLKVAIQSHGGAQAQVVQVLEQVEAVFTVLAVVSDVNLRGALHVLVVDIHVMTLVFI